MSKSHGFSYTCKACVAGLLLSKVRHFLMNRVRCYEMRREMEPRGRIPLQDARSVDGVYRSCTEGLVVLMFGSMRYRLFYTKDSSQPIDGPSGRVQIHLDRSALCWNVRGAVVSTRVFTNGGKAVLSRCKHGASSS